MIKTTIRDREICAQLKAEAERRGFKRAGKALSTLAIERLNQLEGQRSQAAQQSTSNTPAALSA